MEIVSPALPLRAYRDALDHARSSSRALVDACLAAAEARDGEGSRTFTSVFRASATKAAEAADYLPATDALPLRGIPISVKDLFDIAGEITRAGSVVRNDASPATEDAAIVTRLKDAGAVIVGRTNMTEFAFSGLGLNPHYGTPSNSYARSEGRIPGGSSSGAAISVSDGMAVAAIGSDTGGSIRIPAALCGLTGFKPTARRVSTRGVLPLSTTLDSIGPIAPTVACCAAIDQVLTGDRHALDSAPLQGLRLGVLQGYVLDGLEPHVARRFEAALRTLADAGATISKASLSALPEIPVLNNNGGFSGYEAWHWHRSLIEQRAAQYDPRVLSRLVRGSEITDDDYARLTAERARIIALADAEFTGLDALLLPTTPRIAPRIADLVASDEAYFDANAAMLRNPSLFNFLDACALSLPCHLPGEAPVGLMIAARRGFDSRLLAIAHAAESALLSAGCAIPGQGSF